jgi:addiction module HigA family antidote
MTNSHHTMPPGAEIIEQMRDRGMGYDAFADAMDMTPQQAQALLRGETALTPKRAARLATIFGVPASRWLKLEARYRFKRRLREDGQD